MSEVKDPAIKLFGKTIQLLPDEAATANITALLQQNSSTATSLHENKKPSAGGELKETKQVEELICSATSSGVSEDPKTPGAEKETPSPNRTNKNEDPNETSSTSEEKTLKKPDKILPCPRCNSMDTKFCYYNNYNVNQPRHFCKNCQRYWTAGGSMRNVPVGSGRRKNKSAPASHYRHIMVSEALQAVRADAAANRIHHPTLSPNGTVLAFGSDEPLCESMASALNLADKSQNCDANEFHGHEQRNTVPCGGRENGDDHSSRSTSALSNQTEKGNNSVLNESVLKNFQGSPPQLPCFPTPPWPSPWTPMPQPSAFGPSSFPVSFYPVPQYWGYTVRNPWNMPLLPPQPCSSDHSTISLNPNSPTLGKHSRDGQRLQSSNSGKEEEGVLIPKTLRINDPNEAAKSSIWSTLGIKNENINDSRGGTSLFKAFQPKGNEKNHTAETSLVLQANPAALSRSLNFHETS
ncbi:hypothetical protein LguiA_032627 [Lonicera macranthoides]